jgi:Restriction endonuclease BglII
MEFIYKSFRHSGVILNEPEFIDEFNELVGAIASISDKDLINKFNSYRLSSKEKNSKSLSRAITDILTERFFAKEWVTNAAIFQDEKYSASTWTLDFVKKDISIHVGFCDIGVVAWNLIKHVLASDLNQLTKSVQTKIGVVILPTEKLKQTCSFETGTSTFEDYLDHLKPLNNILTIPIYIIGLKAPRTFRVKEFEYMPYKKTGQIVML